MKNAERDNRKRQFLETQGVLYEISECEFDAMEPKNTPSPHIISEFFNKKNIEEQELFDAIMNDEFNGLIEVDLKSSNTTIELFEQLKFPPIFDHIHVEQSNVKFQMLNYLNEKKIKFPLNKQLALRKSFYLFTHISIVIKVTTHRIIGLQPK